MYATITEPARRVVLAIVAAALLLFLTPPQAYAAPPTASAKSTQCTLTSTGSLTFEGSKDVYSFDSSGELAPGKAISTTDCLNSSGVTPLASVALGTKTFTPNSQNFTKTDTNGTFNAQYTVGTGHYVAFSYTIAQSLRNIATGPATAKVSRSPASSTCSYFKFQAVSYIFHWSCTTPYQQTQALRGVWTFPIAVNGVNGTATIDWVFNYRIDATQCAPGVPC